MTPVEEIMELFDIHPGTREEEGYRKIIKTYLDMRQSLLKDLVEISISAQKVIHSGSFHVKDMEEVILLQSMTEYILNNYTKVKEE